MGKPLPEIDSLWDFEHPEKTEQVFRELLPVSEKSSDGAYHIRLLTQLARTQALQKKFGEAHQILDTAESLVEVKQETPMVCCLLERARVFNDTKVKSKAIELSKKAFQITKKIGDYGLALDAAHMLGYILEPDDAIEWNLMAIQMAKSIEDHKAQKWLGTLYSNIAHKYLEIRNYECALKFFKKGLDFRQRRHQIRGMLNAKCDIGKTYRLMGDVETGYEHQMALIEECKTLGVENGYVYEEIAECLMFMERASEAQAYFAKAYCVLSRDCQFPPTEQERLMRMKQLGQVA
ncbi:MAG: hypothetical protein AAFX87_04765 [Bacteroidota bacterium]